ncbi:MAG: hypothetical protein ACI4SC_05930, partial [Candidatus Neoclostridium sp.]
LCLIFSACLNVPGYSKYSPYVGRGLSYVLYDGAYEVKNSDGSGTGTFYVIKGQISFNGSSSFHITPYSLVTHGGTYINIGAIIAQIIALYFIVVGAVKIIQITRYEKKEGEEN